MPDRDLELRGNERRRKGGVHVAVGQHEIGMQVADHRLQPLHRHGSLLSMRPRSHSEMMVGLRDPELLEEVSRHARVVVLTRVDDHVLHVPLHERPVDGCELHEVRAGADDGQDAHRPNGPAG